MAVKTFIVGRNPNVTSGEIPIVINDPTKKVSSNHCRITYDGVNYFIEDLISSNGTFVDGRKISSKTLVNVNSQIKLGGNYNFLLNNQITQKHFNSESNRNEFLEKNISSDNNYNEEYENYNINTGSKFFTFINPLIKTFDNGKFYKFPFIWLYIFFAGIYLLLPLIYIALLLIFDDAIENYVGMFLFYFLFLTFNSWVCFQLLWNRKTELKNYIKAKHEFKASPIFAHYVKTYGEVSGISLAILGVGLTLTQVFFISRNHYFDKYSRELNIFEPDFLNMSGYFLNDFSLSGIIYYPIMGFMIIIIAKVISEFVSAIPAIANNTKK